MAQPNLIIARMTPSPTPRSDPIINLLVQEDFKKRSDFGFETDCRAFSATDGLFRTNLRIQNYSSLSASLPAANLELI